jgi:hypothetical protein
MAVSCLGLLFNPEDGGLASPSKRRLTFTGLNGIMSRKKGLFEVEEIHNLYSHQILMLSFMVCVLLCILR